MFSFCKLIRRFFMPNLYLDASVEKLYFEEPGGVRNVPLIYNLLIASLENSIKSNSLIFSDHDLLFLETDVDPIRNIKIGKFYKKALTGQPVNANRPKLDEIHRAMPQATPKLDRAFLYEPCNLSRSTNIKKDYIFLNTENLKTKWRILSVDFVHTREEVFVLKGVNNLLYLPNLNQLKIPSQYFDEVSNLYNKFLDDLGATPESVIDHCRGLATSLLSAFLSVKESERVDLEKLIGLVDQAVPKRVVLKNCASTINRLHPRRKPNEVEKLKLRELTYDDSEFVVSCISMMIRELDYGN
jgi:hypothetical protein